MLNNNLKLEIENLYNTTSENIHGVSLGYKYKNNQKTNEIGIIFSVQNKKPISELSEDEIIPMKIKINNQEYITDVKEEEPMKSLSCFESTDQEILKLRGRPSLITPLKGGQEIIQFPTGWVPQNGSYTVGTLGFFAVDSTDNKLVGVTNAHVVCKKMLYANDRNSSSETLEPYNTIEKIEFFNKKRYYPSAILYNDNNGSSPFLTYGALHIKRFSLMKLNQTNYTDVALLIMKPSVVSNESYKIHKPTNEPEYESHMPFATTSELDDLLTSNPRLLSTGRTTGPKGWGTNSSCTLRVVNIGVSSGVGYDNMVLPFGDLIRFEYEDGSPSPVAGGDSGSVLVADFSGQRKIIGIVFAGNSFQGLACRIDRVFSELQIRAWDSSYTLNTTVPDYKIVVCDYNDLRSSQSTAQYNGSTYYQVGCTTNNIYEVM